MTDYTGSSSGPFNATVKIMDTTDPVLGGGPTAVSNISRKQLADNDAYLYHIFGGYENVVTVMSSTATTGAFATSDLYRNLVVCGMDADVYMARSLPTCASYPAGGRVTIRRQSDGSLKPLAISTAGGGDFIYDRTGLPYSTIWLHNGETVTLCNIAGGWQMMSFDGGYYDVGKPRYDYVQRRGTLLRDGSLWVRADYPRLWQFINLNSLAVSDTDWLSDPGSTGFYKYKSYFSQGDGSTTFRVPDDRGVFERAYGGGRDVDRITSGDTLHINNLQADALRQHGHTIPESAGAGGSTVIQLGSGTISNAATSATGGSETRPVNVIRWATVVY